MTIQATTKIDVDLTRAQKRRLRLVAELPALAVKATSDRLADAIRELHGYFPTYWTVARAHDAAERAEQAARRAEPEVTDAELAKLGRAEERADHAYQRALSRRDKLARAVLAAPVHSHADIQVKVAAFARGWAEKVSLSDPPFYEDAAMALDAVMRDLEALRSPPAGPGAWIDKVAEYEGACLKVERSVFGGEAHANANADADRLERELCAIPAPDAAALLYKLKFDWSDDSVEDLRQDEGAGAHGFLSVYDDLRRLAAAGVRFEPAPAPDRTAWDEAVSNHRLAVAAYEDATDVADQVCQAIDAACPVEIMTTDGKPWDGGRRHPRWNTVEALDAAEGLSAQARAALRPILAAWILRRERLQDEAGVDRLDELVDATFNAQADAFDRLMTTPAPDLDALIHKMEQFSVATDDDRRGYTDLGYVAHQLNSYLPHRVPIHLYRDALRLADRESPILDLEPFDAEAWINAYEAAGGAVTIPDNRVMVRYQTPACVGLDTKLGAAPWKARAVYLAADKRLMAGADPLHRHYGEARPSARPPAHALRIEHLDAGWLEPWPTDFDRPRPTAGPDDVDDLLAARKLEGVAA